MTRALLALLAAASIAPGAGAAAVQSAAQTGDQVPSTIVEGRGDYPQNPVVPNPTHPGDVTLNFPAVDVRVLAKALLGDLLKLSYTVDPDAKGSVTLVTGAPIARSDILAAFEDALRASKLALINRGGAYTIAPIADAISQAPPVSPDAVGYGTETVELKFISADAIKRIIDPIAPDTVSIADPARNIISITGASGQRRSVRALVAQFDVDWLKGMSFALYVPQHVDARLIVPEIEKLLNGQGSPSAGLVRLISMDRINGVLAISAQPQYLNDVQRWIEVLDREGQSSERRLFVYFVQNGRSADLAKVLVSAFGGAASGGAASGGASGQGGEGDNPATPSGGPGFDVDTLAAPPPLAAQQRPAQNSNMGRGLSSEGGEAGEKAGEEGKPVISSDETNNAVLIYGTPQQYAVVEAALQQLDVPPLQVLIEAAITEVDLTHNFSAGLQWQITNTGGSILSNSATGGAAPTLPGFSIYYAGATIQATLSALSSLTKVNVLSAPKMLVLNNHTATLQVGDQVPIVTASAVSTIGTNAPVVNSVDYRDTGIILKVTPRVNSGGLVLLDIAQEVSDVTTTDSSDIDSPTIEQRRFSSSVAVQDGQTIAMGGLISDKKTVGRSGIPFLSAIPILGILAGTKTTSDSRTELLVLLTPHVIHGPVDADAVTDELRRKIQAIEPLPPFNVRRP